MHHFLGRCVGRGRIPIPRFEVAHRPELVEGQGSLLECSANPPTETICQIVRQIFLKSIECFPCFRSILDTAFASHYIQGTPVACSTVSRCANDRAETARWEICTASRGVGTRIDRHGYRALAHASSWDHGRKFCLAHALYEEMGVGEYLDGLVAGCPHPDTMAARASHCSPSEFGLPGGRTQSTPAPFSVWAFVGCLEFPFWPWGRSSWHVVDLRGRKRLILSHRELGANDCAAPRTCSDRWWSHRFPRGARGSEWSGCLLLGRAYSLAPKGQSGRSLGPTKPGFLAGARRGHCLGITSPLFEPRVCVWTEDFVCGRNGRRVACDFDKRSPGVGARGRLRNQFCVLSLPPRPE